MEVPSLVIKQPWLHDPFVQAHSVTVLCNRGSRDKQVELMKVPEAMVWRVLTQYQQLPSSA
jgi:hypothetical protein